MPSVAGRDGAQRRRMANWAMAGLMLGLVACGDNAAQTAAVDPAASSVTAGSSSTATGASDPVGGPIIDAPTGPLDTSSWVLPAPFYAAGVEPFWRMEIIDGWFSFKRSGLRAIEEPLVQPRQENGADVFETGSLVVTIKREACSNEQGGGGEFTAKVRFDDLDFDGCAFSGSVAASAEAATVIEALAPIDACLAQLGQPALATAVYPRQDGEQMAVGLRAKTGALYECLTQVSDAAVLSLDPIEQGGQPAWMNRFRFLREGTPAAAQCPDAEEVRVADKVVGRLLGRACKF
jgi:uncharacterized membrane protein